MARRVIDLVFLTLVLLAMDQLYRWLHPHVNEVRAVLVGVTAFATLRGLELLGVRRVAAPIGAAAVFASAFGSVLAIEAGWLVSRSPASVAVHVALLGLAYALLEGLVYRRRAERTARNSSSGTSSGGGPAGASATASSRIVSR